MLGVRNYRMEDVEMESERFDQFTRSLGVGRSRRRVVHLLGVLTTMPLISLAGVEGKKRKKGKKGKKKNKGASPAPTTPPTLTVPPPPSCPTGQDRCGGTCRLACPNTTTRHPVTCDCCWNSGAGCSSTGPACCSGAPCPCPPGGSSCGSGCPGQAIGQACSFSAQCDPGLTCNANLVCT